MTGAYNRRDMKRFLPLILFLLAACTSVQPAREPVHVVIVGTTDVHGWYNGHVETPQEGGPGVLWGGLPVFASYLDTLRDEAGGRLLLVDSGDMFQGTLESNLFEGEPVVRGYNALGYTAAAVGNHEFDFGPVGPEAIARKPGDDALGSLRRNAQIAMFPLLAANVVEKSTGKIPSWTQPSMMVRAGAARIGIIGLSTPDTPNVTMAVNVDSLLFTDPVAAAIAEARKLRSEGADAVVVVAHMGGRCSKMDDPNHLESCEKQHEAMAFLEAMPAGTIDGFFAGHTHSNMAHYVNGIPALQGLPLSREFSTLELWIDVDGNRVAKSEIRKPTMICSYVYEGTESCDPKDAKGARLVPRVFGGRTIVADSRVASVIDPYLRRVASKRDERIGVTVTAPFTRTYSSESPLGNLIADMMRRATGADVALMNSGGIRADLRAGDLTYGDVFAVSPFDNYPAMMFMKGSQLVDLLRATTRGARGIMQVSGIRYTIDAARDADKPAAQRDRLVSVTDENGQPLDPEKLYSVIMPDFVAGGGDGAGPVTSKIPPDQVQIHYTAPLRDVLIQELKQASEPLTPKLDGRITVLNAPPRP
jgi:5'-nucleotidase